MSPLTQTGTSSNSSVFFTTGRFGLDAATSARAGTGTVRDQARSQTPIYFEPDLTALRDTAWTAAGGHSSTAACPELVWNLHATLHGDDVIYVDPATTAAFTQAVAVRSMPCLVFAGWHTGRALCSSPDFSRYKLAQRAGAHSGLLEMVRELDADAVSAALQASAQRYVGQDDTSVAALQRTLRLLLVGASSGCIAFVATLCGLPGDER